MVWTNGRAFNLILGSQNTSYMLSHWCRPQLGLASPAVQEVLCITWFKIAYFQDYLERSWGVLVVKKCWRWTALLGHWRKSQIYSMEMKFFTPWKFSGSIYRPASQRTKHNQHNLQHCLQKLRQRDKRTKKTLELMTYNACMFDFSQRTTTFENKLRGMGAPCGGSLKTLPVNWG